MARGDGRELYPLAAGGLAAALALAVAAATAIGRPLLVVVVIVVQFAAALTWVHVSLLPTRAGSLLLVGASTLAVDLLAIPRGGLDLTGVASILATAVVGAVLVQVAEPRRYRVTESIAAALTGVVLAIFAAHLLALARGYGGRRAMLVALVSLAASLVAGRAVDHVAEEPRFMRSSGRGWAGLGVALAVGAVVGAAVAARVAVLTPRDGVLLGLVTAGAASAADLAVDIVVRGDRRIAPGAAVSLATVLPILVAAPPAYAAARLLLG